MSRLFCGLVLIKIDRFYPSTKTCSVCEYVNENISLKERIWNCPYCNTTHDRDINASINICKVGASTFGCKGVRSAINTNWKWKMDNG